jgi:hypothetical protein
MPARRDDDSLDEAYDDPEAPDAADQDADDDPETVACPFCGREVVEGADICPKCGNFIGGSDDRTTRIHAGWVIVTAIIVLAAIGWGLTRWLR